MAWVAFDRAANIIEEETFNESSQRWREMADEIHAEVCTRGFDRDLNSFVQAYGSKRLDASLLLIPLVGFLPATDPRIQGTLQAIEAKLLVDGEFVLRYEATIPATGCPKAKVRFWRAASGSSTITFCRVVMQKRASCSSACSRAAMMWVCLLKSSIQWLAACWVTFRRRIVMSA